MKHKYYSLFSAMMLSAATALNAQIPLMWGARYNAPPDMADEARSIKIDAAGNSYVTGMGYNTAGNLDICTIKYDPSGTQAWVRNYDRGVGDNDYGAMVTVDASGNVYVVGSSYMTGQIYDIAVIKYDASGTQQWASFYNGVGNGMDEGRAIEVNAAGDVFVCGYMTDSAGYFDAVTVKFNSAGTQQWAMRFNGTNNGNDELLDLSIDASSNVYVTGNTESTGFNYDCLTIKYNSSGAQQWFAAYDGPAGGDFGKAITLDMNNNVIIGGRTGISGNWFDYLTLKYDNNGNYQWSASYNNGTPGNNRYEDAWAIISDNAGCIYITGQSQATGGNGANPDFATVKYSPAGGEIWVKRYDGGLTPTSGDDRAAAIAIDDTANIYVAGYSVNTNKDFLVVKYDSTGNEKYTLRWNSNYNQVDNINDIAVASNGDIYVTGQSFNASNGDYMTIRYSYSAVGMTENFLSSQTLSAYPVPSDGMTHFSFAKPGSEQSSLVFTDMTGRVVLSLAVPAGATYFDADLVAIAAGTYSVSQVNATGEIVARTLIVRN